jgi:hypothetical protein
MSVLVDNGWQNEWAEASTPSKMVIRIIFIVGICFQLKGPVKTLLIIVKNGHSNGKGHQNIRIRSARELFAEP